MNQGGSDKEKEALQYLVEKFGIGEVDDINEGDETDEFWEHLGGQEDYFTLPRTQVICFLTILSSELRIIN